MNAQRPVVVLSGNLMHQMVGRYKKIKVITIVYLALHDMKYAKHTLLVFWPWSTNTLRHSSSSKPKKKKTMSHGGVRKFCSQLMFTRSTCPFTTIVYIGACPNRACLECYNACKNVIRTKQRKKKTINKQAKTVLAALRRRSHFVQGTSNQGYQVVVVLLFTSVMYQGAHVCFFRRRPLLFSLHCSLGTFTQRLRDPRLNKVLG